MDRQENLQTEGNVGSSVQTGGAPRTSRTPGLERTLRAMGIISALLLAAGLVMTWHFAPVLPACDIEATTAATNCQTSPMAQKLFYVHVPVAFAGYTAFVLLAFASWRHLDDGQPRWDPLAAASAEVGVLAAGLTLVTGMLWGDAEWGRAWDNSDLKLVLTLVMFLFYVGYLVLRRQVGDPRKRARISAVYAILAFVSVPLSFVAHRIWQRTHPWVFGNPDPNAGITTPWVQETFLVNAAAFIALALFLIIARYDIERSTQAKGVTPEAGR